MRCVLARPTKHLIWRIRTLALILSLIFVFGASSALARGGGHGGGGGHVAEDMEVATRVTIEDIMEVMSARRATLRIRFLVPPWTRLRWIARHLARSSRRR